MVLACTNNIVYTCEYGSMQHPRRITIISICFLILISVIPIGLAQVSTDDETKFIADITNEGIPLMYEIPVAMKTGFSKGTNEDIVSISQDRMISLDLFISKITGYTLSDEMQKVRDQYLSSADILKKDLAEYSTLVNTCGSCVATVNEMYPRLMNQATEMNKKLIQFYQTSQIPIQ